MLVAAPAATQIGLEGAYAMAGGELEVRGTKCKKGQGRGLGVRMRRTSGGPLATEHGPCPDFAYQT